MSFQGALDKETVQKAESVRLGSAEQKELRSRLKEAKSYWEKRVRQAASPIRGHDTTTEQPRSPERRPCGVFEFAARDSPSVELGEIFSYAEWTDLRHARATLDKLLSNVEQNDTEVNEIKVIASLCTQLPQDASVATILIAYIFRSTSKTDEEHYHNAAYNAMLLHSCNVLNPLVQLLSKSVSQPDHLRRGLGLFLVLTMLHQRPHYAKSGTFAPISNGFLDRVVTLRCHEKGFAAFLFHLLSLDVPSYPVRKIVMSLRELALLTANLDHDAALFSHAATVGTAKRSNKVVSKEEDIDYLTGIVHKYFGPVYSFNGSAETLCTVPSALHEALNTVQALRKEREHRTFVHTERLFRVLGPHLNQSIRVLLPLLVSCLNPALLHQSAAELHLEGMDLTDTFAARRHREIILKSVISFLLLLLKLCKRNHKLQFEAIRVQLIERNLIPLLLKTLNQDMEQTLQRSSDQPLLHILHQHAWTCSSDVVDGYVQTMLLHPEPSWRKFYLFSTSLMLLHKATKSSLVHCKVLADLKAHVVLTSRVLSLKQAQFKYYGLCLVKSTMPFIDTAWRNSMLLFHVVSCL